MGGFSRVCVSLFLAGLAAAAPIAAQTVVGPEGPASKTTRLRDLAYRTPSISAPVSPDVFGTTAIGAGVTFYDARFRRVARTDRDHPLVLALASQLRGLSPMEQLARVQSLTLQRVRWMHDLDNMHVADFWSNAGETLERGTGDSEDIAIVEMQALKAAGFNPRDLYISIGRHTRVGAHIVLLARTADGFYLLDDRIGRPVAAAGSHMFTPVLTVGEGKSWIHGRRRYDSLAARAAAR